MVGKFKLHGTMNIATIFGDRMHTKGLEVQLFTAYIIFPFYFNGLRYRTTINYKLIMVICKQNC